MHRLRRSLLVLLLAVGLLAMAGCGSSKKSGGSSSTAAAASTPDTTTTDTTSSGPCQKVTMPAPKGVMHLPKPTLKLDRHKTWTAAVETNCGTFTIKLDVAHDPKTASSFASLARKGFYDSLTFHRIAPGFVIQGGDPQGDGSGGPGYTVVEAPPSNTQYTHGVVAMAKTQNEPDGASGSQFYVVIAADAQLPPQYAVLGKVTKGLDVVDTIGTLPLQTNDPMGSPPIEPVVIKSVTIKGS